MNFEQKFELIQFNVLNNMRVIVNNRKGEVSADTNRIGTNELIGSHLTIKEVKELCAVLYTRYANTLIGKRAVAKMSVIEFSAYLTMALNSRGINIEQGFPVTRMANTERPFGQPVVKVEAGLIDWIVHKLEEYTLSINVVTQLGNPHACLNVSKRQTSPEIRSSSYFSFDRVACYSYVQALREAISEIEAIAIAHDK